MTSILPEPAEGRTDLTQGRGGLTRRARDHGPSPAAAHMRPTGGLQVEVVALLEVVDQARMLRLPAE